MSKRKRSLASFDDVASNNNINVNNNNVDKESEKDSISDLIRAGSKKKKVLTGIYFDEDVLAVLDRLSEQGGRGTKTRIVNDAVKKLFQEQGLM